MESCFVAALRGGFALMYTRLAVKAKGDSSK